jgi:type II secretory pathway pseudopilin PulG
MRALLRDGRRGQSGTTLVELLVSLTIIGFALVIVIGVFSTGLLDATITKRNTAVEAVTQYELDKIHASQFDPNAGAYSECFASENPGAPYVLGSFQAACPDQTYTLRADISCTSGCSTSAETWQVVVVTWPAGTQIGNPVALIKVNR